MASILKVDKLDPQSGTALEIGTSGDTVTVPSGATFTVSGTMNASSITAGTVATARLGTGTASSSTILYGDQTYKTEPAAGLTTVDQWRLTSSSTSDAEPITSNLERVDTSGQGTLGSAMTESSGIFTFPSTGIWLVMFDAKFSYAGNENSVQFEIFVKTNDSDYTMVAYNGDAITQSGGSSYRGCSTTSSLIDVTDVANVKVQFHVITGGSATCEGTSTDNRTVMTFIRVGDT